MIDTGILIASSVQDILQLALHAYHNYMTLLNYLMCLEKGYDSCA